MRALFLALIIITSVAAGVEAVVVQRDTILIERDDGLVLTGTMFRTSSRGPGILLLHQCNRDRLSYDKLAQYLAYQGFHVLTFDFRGFGDSQNDHNRDFHSQQDTLWPKFAGDVDAACAYLQAQGGVKSDRIGVLGASCGGTQALLLAERNDAVKAMAFLSSSLPWLKNDERVQFAKESGLPLLCIASEEDKSTAERTEMVFDNSPNGGSRLILYKGELHGTPLFEFDEGLYSTISTWFRKQLVE